MRLEGNRYGAVNVVVWADRVHVAAGRHSLNYPTVARALLPPDGLIKVGVFDDTTGDVDLDAGDVPAARARSLVSDWLNLPDGALDQQLSATAAVYARRREVETLSRSANPAHRAFAAHIRTRLAE